MSWSTRRSISHNCNLYILHIVLELLSKLNTRKQGVWFNGRKSLSNGHLQMYLCVRWCFCGMKTWAFQTGQNRSHLETFSFEVGGEWGHTFWWQEADEFLSWEPSRYRKGERRCVFNFIFIHQRRKKKKWEEERMRAMEKKHGSLGVSFNSTMWTEACCIFSGSPTILFTFLRPFIISIGQPLPRLECTPPLPPPPPPIPVPTAPHSSFCSGWLLPQSHTHKDRRGRISTDCCGTEQYVLVRAIDWKTSKGLEFFSFFPFFSFSFSPPPPPLLFISWDCLVDGQPLRFCRRPSAACARVWYLIVGSWERVSHSRSHISWIWYNMEHRY